MQRVKETLVRNMIESDSINMKSSVLLFGINHLNERLVVESGNHFSRGDFSTQSLLGKEVSCFSKAEISSCNGPLNIL